MSFLYPLGLLGLIAVPILIAIYIIKNKYTEQVISATYIWTLSEKFIKRRLPINKIAGIISLILQILAVILISFAIAHPVFTVPASGNYYNFILDGSGSMNALCEDKSRFETAKEQINSIISSSGNGSIYSLTLAGENNEQIFKEITDKERAITLVNGIKPAYSATGVVDALGEAQKIFNEKPYVRTYLLTDKSYGENENVTVINVAQGAGENYGVTGVKCAISGGKLIVSGGVVSYESDAELTVNLYFDGKTDAERSIKLKADKLSVIPFEFVCDRTEYVSARVAIQNADSLALDNECITFNVKSQNSYTALIVSDDPFFIQAMLLTRGNVKISIISPEKFSAQSGFNLYVFDSCAPANLPSDGAVWFINPTASVERSGFSFQSEVELASSKTLEYTASSASLARLLTSGVIKQDIAVKKYVKCRLYRSFTTLLSFEGSPVVFVGTNDYRNREIVFAFDFHASNFAALADCAILCGNLINYTFPSVISQSSYTCGDSVAINVIPNCTAITVHSPDGNTEYLDTALSMVEYKLREVGEYRITARVEDELKTFSLYSSLPEEERVLTASGESASLTGKPTDKKLNGTFDKLFIFIVIIAALAAADWAVYCYEQYQLR